MKFTAPQTPQGFSNKSMQMPRLSSNSEIGRASCTSFNEPADDIFSWKIYPHGPEIAYTKALHSAGRCDSSCI